MKAKNIIQVFGVLKQTVWDNLSDAAYLTLSRNIVKGDDIIKGQQEIVKNAMDKKVDKSVIEDYHGYLSAEHEKRELPFSAKKFAEVEKKVKEYEEASNKMFAKLSEDEIPFAFDKIDLTDYKRLMAANPHLKEDLCRHMGTLVILPE